jgi:hypothetical protein
MNPPSIKSFRLLVWIAVIVNILAYIGCIVIPPSEIYKDPLQWSGFMGLPHEVSSFIYTVRDLLFLTGLVLFGLAFSWARIGLLLIEALNWSLTLTGGVSVHLPVQSAIYWLAWYLLIVPLILSLFTPCSNYFDKYGIFCKKPNKTLP